MQFGLRKGPVQYNKLLEKNRRVRTMSLCVFLASENHITVFLTLPGFTLSAPQCISPSSFCLSPKPPLSPYWIILLSFFHLKIITHLGELSLSSLSKTYGLCTEEFMLQTVLSWTTSKQETDESWPHPWFIFTVCWICWGAEVLSLWRERLENSQPSALNGCSVTSRKADDWGEEGAAKFHQLEMWSQSLLIVDKQQNKVASTFLPWIMYNWQRTIFKDHDVQCQC